jgi:release factor glutamine methyltransferase
LLARHALGFSRAEYLVRRNEPARELQLRGYDELITRRMRREPVQYITETQEFWGLTLAVSPAALIPRPETEGLVEEVLNRLKDVPSPRVLDAGTGSGCIAIAIARERSDARVVATDISADALALARANAARHAVDIEFKLAPFVPADEFDLDMIVSNPPYVAESALAALQPEVRDYEPRIALVGGVDGCDAFRSLFSSAPRALRPRGWLLVELGIGQVDTVQSLGRNAGFAVRAVRLDLQQIPRVAVLQAGNPQPI